MGRNINIVYGAYFENIDDENNADNKIIAKFVKSIYEKYKSYVEEEYGETEMHEFEGCYYQFSENNEYELLTDIFDYCFNECPFHVITRNGDDFMLVISNIYDTLYHGSSVKDIMTQEHEELITKARELLKEIGMEDLWERFEWRIDYSDFF